VSSASAKGVGQHGLGDLADEGDVVDHLRRDAPTDVADDGRVAELDAEELCGVDARVQARDHEQPQVGEDDGALVPAGGGKGTVALEDGIDVGHRHRGAPFVGVTVWWARAAPVG
jgi:hypothetical protein